MFLQHAEFALGLGQILGSKTKYRVVLLGEHRAYLVNYIIMYTEDILKPEVSIVLPQDQTDNQQTRHDEVQQSTVVDEAILVESLHEFTALLNFFFSGFFADAILNVGLSHFVMLVDVFLRLEAK